MSLRIKNFILVLSLTGLTTACGNIPLINGVLGLPNNGAVIGSGGAISEGDESYDDASVNAYIPTGADEISDGTTFAANDIPNDTASEVEVDTGSWTETTSTRSSGSGAATAPSDGSISGEDPATSDSAPGADTPDTYLPTGTVDLPVSISREDGDDDCTTDTEGDIQPVMMTYSSSSSARRSSNHSSSRMMVKEEKVSMNYSRVARTSQLTLDLRQVAADTNDNDTSSGDVDYETCQVEVDEDGNTIHTWQPVDPSVVRDLQLNNRHDIVIGTMVPTDTGWTQSAIRVPVDQNGHFEFSNDFLIQSQNSFNYVGVIDKDAESDASPADTLVIQNQPDKVSIDRTKNLNSYVEMNKLETAPAIKF